MQELKTRILELSYERKLSHLGSCLGAVEIIDTIYGIKKPDEKFVLSAGHAGLALYVVLEKYGLLEIPDSFIIHPDRLAMPEVDCSTGSLGQGLPIALGMALADRGKDVYCLISDGECAEGSIWEALRIKTHLRVSNLKIYVNINSYGAYDSIDRNELANRLHAFCPDINIVHTRQEGPVFLHGLEAHYHVMTEDDYKQALEWIKQSIL